MDTILVWYPLWPWESFPCNAIDTIQHPDGWDCLLYSIEVEYNKWEL